MFPVCTCLFYIIFIVFYVILFCSAPLSSAESGAIQMSWSIVICDYYIYGFALTRQTIVPLPTCPLTADSVYHNFFLSIAFNHVFCYYQHLA